MSNRILLCVAVLAGSLATAGPAAAARATSPPLHRISAVLTGSDRPDVLGIATDHRYAFFQVRIGTLRVFDSLRRRTRDVALPDGRSCLPIDAAGGDVVLRCGGPGAPAPGSVQDIFVVVDAATGRVQQIPIDPGNDVWRLGRTWIHAVSGDKERALYVNRRTGRVVEEDEADPYPALNLDGPSLRVDVRPLIRFGQRRCRDGTFDCQTMTFRGRRRELGKARGRGTYGEQEPPIATWWDKDTAHALDVRDGRTYVWRFDRRPPGGAVVQHTDHAAFFARPARNGSYPQRSGLFASYLGR